MPKQNDPLKNLRIAAPCDMAWERMAGDERVRHCTLCNLNVYNFAEMTRDEIRELFLRTEGRVCGRLYRRADGTLLTRDCPTGLRALRRRMSRVATAIVAALFSVAAFASGGRTCERPRLRRHGSKMSLAIEQAATPQQAVVTGVAELNGSPLPGLTITLRDEAEPHRVMTVTTDANGAFTLSSLSDGVYTITAELEGLRPAVMEHVALKRNEITHARVAMRFDGNAETITVGGAAIIEPDMSSVHTTFTEYQIDQLPH